MVDAIDVARIALSDARSRVIRAEKELADAVAARDRAEGRLYDLEDKQHEQRI